MVSKDGSLGKFIREIHSGLVCSGKSMGLIMVRVIILGDSPRRLYGGRSIPIFRIFKILVDGVWGKDEYRFGEIIGWESFWIERIRQI